MRHSLLRLDSEILTTKKHFCLAEVVSFSSFRGLLLTPARARDLGRPLHRSILKQIEPMQDIVKELFRNVSVDLQGLDAHRYQRNISIGIQEYMEAVLFQHYLETQKVMPYEEAATTLPQNMLLTYEDYALGLFDMTGELMRFAITYMATRGGLPKSNQDDASHSALSDMQELGNQLEMLDVGGSFALSKEFERKLKTTKSSVEKVEHSVYNMIVRGSERPKGWRPDVSILDGPSESEQIESY